LSLEKRLLRFGQQEELGPVDLQRGGAEKVGSEKFPEVAGRQKLKAGGDVRSTEITSLTSRGWWGRGDNRVLHTTIM
jgi:hypothetical protein